MPNLGSASTFKSIAALAFLFGKRCFFRSRQVPNNAVAQINLTVLITQGKPTRGAIKMIITGKTTPPTPPTVHTMLVARAYLLENQCPTAVMLGLKRREAEQPPKTLNVSRN
jgi:hypothetical protein